MGHNIKWISLWMMLWPKSLVIVWFFFSLFELMWTGLPMWQKKKNNNQGARFKYRLLLSFYIYIFIHPITYVCLKCWNDMCSQDRKTLEITVTIETVSLSNFFLIYEASVLKVAPVKKIKVFCCFVGATTLITGLLRGSPTLVIVSAKVNSLPKHSYVCNYCNHFRLQNTLQLNQAVAPRKD